MLYAATAALLFVIMLLGFQQFYLHGRGYPDHELAPPIRRLLLAHGLAMTGWMTLFLVQSLLIVSGNRRLHMTLGRLGAVLAVVMVLLGLWLPIATTRVEPDVTLWGLDRRHFMAIPMLSILSFGAFVAVGISQRRRPEIHRPMMLMATLTIVAAASDRITGLPGLFAMSVWGRAFGPFFPAICIGGVLLVAKWALSHKFDRWYAAGYVAMTGVCAFIMDVAHTRLWDQFTAFLVR
jgi:hypothetical protein